MSKKLLIYGVAFGSASAALSYIYLVSAIYKGGVAAQLLSVLSELFVIPAIAIILLLKSIKTENPDTFTMGRAIFAGFLVSIMISATVSLLFSYVAQFKPEVISALMDYKEQLFRANETFKSLSPKEQAENISQLRDNYTPGRQFLMLIFLGAGRGLFMSAIIAYFMKAKMNN